MKKLIYSSLTIALLFIGMQGVEAATKVCEYENGNTRYTLNIVTNHNSSTTSGKLYGAQANAKDDPQQVDVSDWDNRIECPNSVVLTQTGSGNKITLKAINPRPSNFMSETVLNYKKTTNNISNISGNLTCTYTSKSGEGKVTITTAPNRVTTITYAGNNSTIKDRIGKSGSDTYGDIYMTTDSLVEDSNFMQNGKYDCPAQFHFFHGTKLNVTNYTTTDYVSYGFVYDKVVQTEEYPINSISTFTLENKNNTISAPTVTGACNFENAVTGYYSFTLSTYADGTYGVSFSGTYWKNPSPIIDIPKNMSCSQIEKLYTDCTLGGACTISTTNRTGYTEMNKSNNQTTGDDILEGSALDGTKYLNLMQQLKVPMSQLCNYDKVAQFNLTIGNTTRTFDSLPKTFNENSLCQDETCGEQQTVSCNGSSILQSTNIDHYVNLGLMNVANYCKTIYKSYGNDRNNKVLEERMKECVNFNEFYEKVVENNLVQDLKTDCPLLSADMIAKLKWVLNLFRIVAPLLAIGFGTVDFIKVMVMGDADKEMKAASKKLLTRIVAAILLLVIPTIIAFLLDVFLGDQDGYNSDNPFCDIVDWKE